MVINSVANRTCGHPIKKKFSCRNDQIWYHCSCVVLFPYRNDKPHLAGIDLAERRSNFTPDALGKAKNPIFTQLKSIKKSRLLVPWKEKNCNQFLVAATTTSSSLRNGGSRLEFLEKSFFWEIFGCRLGRNNGTWPCHNQNSSNERTIACRGRRRIYA